MSQLYRILFCLFFFVSAVSAADEQANLPTDRRIALTFDDLPWVMNRNDPPPALAEHFDHLVKALVTADVPAIGFVNDGKLYRENDVCPERIQMLEDWLDAGLELGNHTAWHGDLHELGLNAFEQDILMGERHLKPMLAKRGKQARWFRFPFLRTGRSAEDKAAITGFLASHGYRSAPVTINSSEWIFALAYRHALARGDAPEALARLRNEYVVYMLAKLDYYERRSAQLLGYPVAQVMLIHANELNTDSLADLVAGIRGRGYRFVTLDEAVSDPAYLRPDGYVGELGTSWIHRWAKAEHRPDSFYFGDPKTPRWIMELAGVEKSAE